MSLVRLLPLKLTVMFLILFSALGAEEKTLPQGLGVSVLLYHGITDKYDASQVYTISKAQLREHLGAIKLAGYTTINTHDLYDYFYKKKPLPEKSCMITFDDGRKDSYLFADPLLKEFGMQAVMFVTTVVQKNESANYLSWGKLNKMHESGRWDIQSHGFKFHNLIPINSLGEDGDFGSNLMWLEKEKRLETVDEYKERLSKDLQHSKTDIETHIEGAKVIAFAFPFGDFGGGSENLDPALAIALNYQVVNAEFPLSFGTVEFDINKYQPTPTPHLIMRFMDNGSFTPQQIIELLQSSLP